MGLRFHYLWKSSPTISFCSTFLLHLSPQVLVELLSTVGSDKEAASAASYLSETQIKEKLVQLRLERDTWKDNSMRDANEMPPETELNEVFLIGL